MIAPKRVLVLCPHTDDGELGCGGSLARFAREGSRVFYAYFSSCEQSVPSGFDKHVLKEEMAKATDVLGIDGRDIIAHDFPVRRFPSFRQDILEALIAVRDHTNPDLVLLPSSNDIHQDHATIYAEGIRAFKGRSILSYEMPWNTQCFSSDIFVQLSEADVKKKISAVQAYVSQRNRPYTSEGFLEALAQLRGLQGGSAYAEAFEAIRIIF
jgi:N-acetylglucosamine malate deacetylase 1